MATDDVLARAIDGIADGAVVNWPQLHGLARSDEERAELEWLQVLGNLAHVHRSAPSSIEEDGATTRAATTAEITEAREVWGRYRLIRKMGAGSFGSVYRAWDPQLERYVAIKILHAHVEDDRTRQRLLREGRALAKVQHGNVVQVFGVEAHGSRVGLCMELVSGETLSDVLRSHGRLNDREATAVGEDVCRALAAVHAAGYVHRDVKAQNVMRDKAGKIVLMDFGTGQDTSRRRQPDLVGTPLYMAPELLAGEPASVQSDVYAAGVLLYHLVTGHYPVEGRTELDVIDAHRAGRRRPLLERRSDLPLPFVQVVSKALAPNPAERWESAGAMLEALGALTQPASDERTWVAVTRRSAVAALAIVAGLIAIGMVSSRFFNSVLGREEFAQESIGDWLYWGAVAMVAPMVMVLMVLVGLACLRLGLRFVLSVWPRARTAVDNLTLTVWRLGLDDVESAAAGALVTSVAVLVATWWSLRSDFFALFAVTPNIGTTPVEALAYLSPDLFERHRDYRFWFEWACIVVVVAWWVPLRVAARHGRQVPFGMVGAAVAILLLGLLLLHFPYRLLYHAEFDPVEWRGQRCYVLGEKAGNDLLFCPELDPPRNRVVPRSETDRTHVGTKVNPFQQASSSPGERP